MASTRGRPPRLPFPPLYKPIRERGPVDGAYAPLFCARWCWSGHPDLFDVLDLDKNEVIDEIEIADGLGRAGIAVLNGDTAGPLSADVWDGSRDAFPLIDANRDGLVSQVELERALGPQPSASRTGIPPTAQRCPRSRCTSGARTRAA